MSKPAKSEKKKTTKILFLLFLVGILYPTFNMSLETSSLPVHNLDTGLDYETISEAIDAHETLEGHTIKVDTGTYYERVSIYKDNLTILGENPNNTIIDSNGIGDVVYITANNIRLSGFTIRNAGWAGVYLDSANNNTLVGNIITDNWEYGIYADYSDNNTIRENTVTDNWHGIFFWYSDNNLIYHNNFINNTVQVYNEMSNNTWDNGYPSGGNHWSDYTGVDANDDGIGDTPYIIDAENQDRYPLMKPWAPTHDVAITNLVDAKTVVGHGFALRINVTIANRGSYTETFDVTVYANSTSIATKSVTLASGSSRIFTLTWNTTNTAKGNYTISAYAWPVPGETDTADNNMTDGWVIVAMVGDVTGNGGYPDGEVNIRDIAAIARSYGSYKGHPRYVANYDLDCNGDIDIRDVAAAARNFGKVDP